MKYCKPLFAIILTLSILFIYTFYPSNVSAETLFSRYAALIDAEHNVNNEDIDWSKVHVYTYRIAPGLAYGKGCSLCCPACRHMLRDKGIKSIYYTEEYGYGHIILDD